MTSKSVRIAARVAPDVAETIREAAHASGMSISAFVGAAASERAERPVNSEHVTVVPSDYFDQLLKWLDEPAQPIPQLKKAFERLERVVIDEGSSYIIRREDE